MTRHTTLCVMTRGSTGSVTRCTNTVSSGDLHRRERRTEDCAERVTETTRTARLAELRGRRTTLSPFVVTVNLPFCYHHHLLNYFLCMLLTLCFWRQYNCVRITIFKKTLCIPFPCPLLKDHLRICSFIFNPIRTLIILLSDFNKSFDIIYHG